jgi:endonuclease VIII
VEGPSLYLAAEQLRPLRGERVRAVSGNTKVDKDRLLGLVVRDVFAWGKHLVFQFDTFALRIHFLLFGSFEAKVGKVWVTGDYRRTREPRLVMKFGRGTIRMFNCSVKFIESRSAKRTYDFSVDIMARAWDPGLALRNTRARDHEQIADILLDQEVFAGVGNIIKNEVLSIVRLHPQEIVKSLDDKSLKQLITQTRAFSRQFLRWRRKFVLRKNLKVHRRATCPHCGGKLSRMKTGKRSRWSYWCQDCQPRKAK